MDKSKLWIFLKNKTEDACFRSLLELLTYNDFLCLLQNTVNKKSIQFLVFYFKKLLPRGDGLKKMRPITHKVLGFYEESRPDYFIIIFSCD